MARSREYRIWCAMKTRCNNPNADNYHNYGGRGISVCSRWDNFHAFLEDMGNSNGMTIERIDHDGDYTPDNCKWATRKEQGNNKRNNRNLEMDGICLTVQQWSEKTSIKEATIRKRLKLGWSVSKALTTKAIIGRNQHGVS